MRTLKAIYEVIKYPYGPYNRTWIRNAYLHIVFRRKCGWYGDQG